MRCPACPALLAVALALAGCGSPRHPAQEEDARSRSAEAAAASESPAPDPLANVVWQRADGGGPEGELRIFLADGTLVEDSCGEVYALRTWRRVSPDEIVLVEDVEIPARIVALSAEELRLSLALVGGAREEVAYRRARPPFICPEMHR